jgi:hypothetical protein
MTHTGTRKFVRPLAFHPGWAVTLFLSGFTGGPVALADSDYFQPGNLLLSRVLYDNNASNVEVGALLPPNCVGAACVMATSNGTYPYVWNNNLVDGSFGITAKIVLDQLSPLSGQFINRSKCPIAHKTESPRPKIRWWAAFRPNPKWRSICRPMVSS